MVKTFFKKSPAATWRFIAIILGIALVIALLFLYQADSSRSDTAELQRIKSEHPYLDPLQAFYKDEDLLVNLRPLRERLQQIASGTPVTVYFESLNTGANVSINPGLSFFPGSLMKIPVAMAVMKKVEMGEWQLSNELVLTDADKNSNWGDVYKLPTGTRFTIDDLLKRLLVDSDDTVRAIFVRNLGEERIDDVLQYLGMHDLFNQNFQVSAQRYSNFFRSLYNASYLSTDSSEKLLQVMAIPHDIKLIRNGLSKDVVFSHKIGVYGAAHEDSGIVYVPNRPYIITIMVNSNDEQYVSKMMTDISAAVYRYVTTGAV